MIWVLLTFLSASLLGIYDIFKKLSLNKNAVIPVLFLSSTVNAIIFIPFLLVAYFGDFSPQSLLNFGHLTLFDHLLFFIKSVIVGSSWLLAYYALKHLPITIVSPIRSSGPVWTILGALIIFGEKLSIWQWIGIFLTMFFYYLFGQVGQKEGISFRNNKWVIFMTISTIIGSISSLYDKYLINHYNRLAVQAYYHIYMVPLMFLLLMVLWYPKRHKERFEWRWSIPLIGICLTAADFIYFWALSFPGALIAVVSTIRRGSVIFSFSIGAIIFKDKNIKQKALVLLGILLGIVVIMLA